MAFLDDFSHENAVHGNPEKTVFDPSSESEITPNGSIAVVTADRTSEEERRLVRKYANMPDPSGRNYS
jgi:hypothetical protein